MTSGCLHRASRTLFEEDKVKLTLSHWTSAVTNVLVTYSLAELKNNSAVLLLQGSTKHQVLC